MGREKAGSSNSVPAHNITLVGLIEVGHAAGGGNFFLTTPVSFEKP